MAKKVHLEIPSGLNRIETWLKTASVAGLHGDWATVVSGYAKVATSAAALLIGVIDADWTNDANNSAVPIRIDENAIYKMEQATTLVQATHVGNAYNLSDERTLDLTGTSNKPLVVVGIAPDGDAFVRINKHLGSGTL